MRPVYPATGPIAYKAQPGSASPQVDTIGKSGRRRPNSLSTKRRDNATWNEQARRDGIERIVVEPAFFEVPIPHLADAAPERVVHIADVHPRLGDALQAPETVPSKPSPVSTEADQLQLNLGGFLGGVLQSTARFPLFLWRSATVEARPPE